MGSLFEMYLSGGDPVELYRRGSESLDLVDWLENQLSPYRPESEIGRVNTLAYEQPVPVSRNVMALLLDARRWAKATRGAVDCTAGRLIRAWGFFRQGEAHGEAAAPPSAEELAEITQQIGWQAVQLDTEAMTVRFLSPMIEIHLGAVGKGYVTQMAATYLRSVGVECALLHSGQSSLVAIGAPPNNEGWIVGVEDPARPERAFATVTLRDRALSVSSTRGQTTRIEGRCYSHLLDPRRGTPVEGNVTAVVLSPDGAECEAFSTAFCIHGEAFAEEFCTASEDVGCVMLTAPPAETPAAEVTLGRIYGRLAAQYVHVVEDF